MLRLLQTQQQTHEDLFLGQYDWLRGWALQLSGGNQAQAEDLLHDGFVRFSITRPPLAALGDGRPYLYTLLRNLHLSRVRRASLVETVPLGVLDAESLRLALTEASSDDRLAIRDELRAVCHWICERKAVFRGASILALRFFHGYAPTEIASLLRVPRKSVDDWLRIARHEASRAVTTLRPSLSPSMVEDTPDRFLEGLRAHIFASRTGPCRSDRELRAELTRSEPMTTAWLAHVVGCRHCLERVSDILELPPPHLRPPADGAERPRSTASGRHRAHPSAPSSRRESATLRAGLIESVHAILTHRPMALQLVANGWIVGAQEVSSRVSVQEVRLHLDEPLGYVEVLSDAGLGLLYLPVELPPSGPVEQRLSVTLGEGRTLEATVIFSGPWPTLRVRYVDPHLTSAEWASAPLAQDSIASRPARVWRFWPPTPHLAFALLVLGLLVILAGTSDRVWAALRDMARVARELLVPSPVILPTRGVTLIVRPPEIPEARPVRLPSISSRAVLAPAEIAALDVRALSVLDSLGALMGEQLRLTRGASGVRVEGIVESAPRKKELQSALRTLGSPEQVRVRIATIDEALARRRQMARRSATVQDYSLDRGTLAGESVIDEYVRRHPDRAGANAADTRVEQMASDLVARSRRIVLHSLAIASIAERYDANELRALNPVAYAEWRALIQQHGTVIHDEASHLMRQLQGLAAVEERATPGTNAPGRAGSNAGTQSIESAVAALMTSVAEVDEGVRAWFTASIGTPPPVTLEVLTTRTEDLQRLGAVLANLDR
jgi:DNA-directed RNA polymerase specialized sigma24 family protein